MYKKRRSRNPRPMRVNSGEHKRRMLSHAGSMREATTSRLDTLIKIAKEDGHIGDRERSSIIKELIKNGMD